MEKAFVRSRRNQIRRQPPPCHESVKCAPEIRHDDQEQRLTDRFVSEPRGEGIVEDAHELGCEATCDGADTQVNDRVGRGSHAQRRDHLVGGP